MAFDDPARATLAAAAASADRMGRSMFVAADPTGVAAYLFDFGARTRTPIITGRSYANTAHILGLKWDRGCYGGLDQQTWEMFDPAPESPAMTAARTDAALEPFPAPINEASFAAVAALRDI